MWSAEAVEAGGRTGRMLGAEAPNSHRAPTTDRDAPSLPSNRYAAHDSLSHSKSKPIAQVWTGTERTCTLALIEEKDGRDMRPTYARGTRKSVKNLPRPQTEN